MIIKSAYKDKGIYHIIRTAPKYLVEAFFKQIPNYIILWYLKSFRSSDTFEFQGRAYHYLFHMHCTTWRNERATIIPIALEIVKKYEEKNKRILEVGNVLSYLYPVSHDILDKYEIIDGVINDDVVDFKPSKPYDLIISIVTLQCIGWNKYPREARKILRAIENLKKMLATSGQIVIVHGLGENREMDELLRKGELKLNKQFYLRKISRYNWKEAVWDDVKDLDYDYSTPSANGVVIGIIENAHAETKLF